MVQAVHANTKPTDVLSVLERIVRYHTNNPDDEESDDSEDSEEEGSSGFFYITLSELNKHNLTLSDLSRHREKIYSAIGDGYIVDKRGKQVYQLIERGIYSSPITEKHAILVSLCNHMFNEEPDPAYG